MKRGLLVLTEALLTTSVFGETIFEAIQGEFRQKITHTRLLLNQGAGEEVLY